jgi:hypothetical protein
MPPGNSRFSTRMAWPMKGSRMPAMRMGATMMSWNPNSWNAATAWAENVSSDLENA